MSEPLFTISPSTNTPVLYRDTITAEAIALLPSKADTAFEVYQKTSFKDRENIVHRALNLMLERKDDLAKELTEQMGRPIAYTAKEITTAVARGQYLLKISNEALQDTPGEPEEGFKRYIKKVPVGPVLIIFAWNVSRRWSCSGTDAVLVSLSHPREFSHSSITGGQFRDTQTIASNTDGSGADVRYFL